jgi:hypothetical protein
MIIWSFAQTLDSFLLQNQFSFDQVWKDKEKHSFELEIGQAYG